MSRPYKPPAHPKTEGFTPLTLDSHRDVTPLYRMVEVVWDADGRLRQEGRIWHDDLARLRKFGRAVATNTASHRVMITDAVGDIVEEVAIATPDDRHSIWDSWERVDLPPAPPVVRRARVQKPRTATLLDALGRSQMAVADEVDLAISTATEAIAAATAAEDPVPHANEAPTPRDLPTLHDSHTKSDLVAPARESTLP